MASIDRSFLVLGALALAALPARAQMYVVQELAPVSAFGGRGFDLNDAGVAVGHGLSPSLQLHALLWPGVGVTDLTPTNSLAEASGLSESGIVAGWAQNAQGQTEAVRWIGGAPTFLGKLPGHIGSFAQDGNDAGLIAGWSVTSVGDPVASIWNGGAPQAIDGTFSWAFAVSETGDVVGRRWVGVDVQGFRWRAGTLTVLPDLGPNNASAVGISPSGLIAGNAASAADGKLHGVVWDEDLQITDLGLFVDFFSTQATDVNDAGVAVGGAINPEGDVFRALVWRGHGTEDLNALIPPGSGWVLLDAQAVNARGEIVGIGTKNGFSGSRAFLLKPDAWTDGGSALAGIAGVPLLVGAGTLAAGSSNSVALSHAAPAAFSGVFVAFASTPVPFYGGTLLAFPFTLLLYRTTSPAGGSSIPFVMPAGVPAGTEVWVQWAIQDAAAIQGVALSNAILGVTP